MRLFLRLVKESLLAYLHLIRLLWQYYQREGARSVAACLVNGKHLDLSQGFALDGTVLVVNREGKKTFRVPASRILGIIDKGDYGYV